MYYKCAVIKCKSRYGDQNISFHSLPNDYVDKQKWCKALNLKISDLSKIVRVCSRHFYQEDFVKFQGKKGKNNIANGLSMRILIYFHL